MDLDQIKADYRDTDLMTRSAPEASKWVLAIVWGEGVRDGGPAQREVLLMRAADEHDVEPAVLAMGRQMVRRRPEAAGAEDALESAIA